MDEHICCQNGLNPTDIVVVMVPFPAQGHINQLIHLTRLITTYKIPVHFAGSAIHNRQAKLRLHGWNLERTSNIHFHDYQLPPFTSLQPDPNTNIKFPQHLQPLFDASLHLRQPVYSLLKELSNKYRKVIIIHDNLMASVVQDLKLIPNAESYTFLSVSAFTIFFNKWESLKDKPFELDHDVPAHIPSREGCFTPEFEKFIANQHKILSEFESGRLFNSCKIIEGRYLALLSKLQTDSKRKLFAVGPFNPVKIEGKPGFFRHPALDWLDKQEKDSVIYVSFGTITSMNDEQIRELGIGLWKSDQKFIWVLRDSDKSDVFAPNQGRKLELPKGYEEKVKKRGIIVRDWAPQLEILAHPSVGGFLSHCGWNSCLESITMGVPIIAWPMHSDQPKNSILITKVLGIGLLVSDCEHRDELDASTSVENVVRRLMVSDEGVAMRRRAVELGVAVRESVEDRGSSRVELKSFIAHISR
ncbi:zeatin O-glucosyltransferase-like [Amaranthus tricolor]|uniref:zeatin O-glucosyltransferase-like n=1 Tax=Amaranthus tricolor TaxID=29722 RepID=UPI00258D5A0B|nr:zeatin O-glucosyltransferase-like [Amaranthus tricolor]